MEEAALSRFNDLEAMLLAKLISEEMHTSGASQRYANLLKMEPYLMELLLLHTIAEDGARGSNTRTSHIGQWQFRLCIAAKVLLLSTDSLLFVWQI